MYVRYVRYVWHIILHRLLARIVLTLIVMSNIKISSNLFSISFHLFYNCFLTAAAKSNELIYEFKYKMCNGNGMLCFNDWKEFLITKLICSGKNVYWKLSLCKCILIFQWRWEGQKTLSNCSFLYINFKC